MKSLLIFVISVMVVITAACSGVIVTGSGEIVTQEMDFTGFDKLDISQGFNVDVNQGDEFSVVIRADDNIVEYLQVEKVGDTLKIDLEQNRVIGVSTLEAEITMPALVGLVVSGGSDATVSGTGDEISVDASGGSDVDLASFEVVNASVVASGGSDVTVNASGTLNADASGGSQVYYLGSPTMGQIDTSGGSDVDPR